MASKSKKGKTLREVFSYEGYERGYTAGEDDIPDDIEESEERSQEEVMYQNLLTKEVLKAAWDQTYPENGLVEEKAFEFFYQVIEPIVHAVNTLNDKMDHVNNGCKIFQKHFKDEIAKCLKESPEDG